MTQRVKSCADVFAQRGDPWVSEREGIRSFGRILQTEDADRDQYLSQADGTPGYVKRLATQRNHEPPSEPRGKLRDVHVQKRIAEAMRRLNKRIK